MNEQYARAAIQSRPADTIVCRANASSGTSMPEERLPFTIRLVQSEEALWKAVRIRHSAYARHVPALAEKLRAPEQADFDSDTVVLLAESKLDGSPLGTARIQSNLHKSLSVEQSVELPLKMRHRPLAEVTRLGIEEGRIGRLVKAAMLKAVFRYCEQNGMDYMVAAGRSPVDRQYEQLMFENVFPELGYIPLQHAGNLPHRVMAFHMASGYARWEAANHPLFKFFFRTHHADIDLSSSGITRPGNALPSSHFSGRAAPLRTGARAIA